MSAPGLLWSPALFLLFLIPLMAWAYRWAVRARSSTHASYPGAGLLSLVAAKARPWRHVPAAFYLLALALGFVALARPTAKMLYPDDMSGIMLAIETGRSMSAPDILPTRLGATQVAAKAMADAVPDSIKMGLTTFAGYGALNVPLTNDRKRLKEGIDALSIGGGYAFSDGMISSLEALPVEDPEEGLPGAIILFSHGHDNSGKDPLAIADEAAARGIKIHTVGVGTHGNNFSEDILKLVADRTGGEYYPIFSAADLTNAHEELGKVITLRPRTTEVTSFAAIGAAFLLMMSLGFAEFRRRVI